MLTRLVNYFIPNKAERSIDSLRSSRILVKFLLVTGAINFLYIANAVAIGFYPMEYVLLANGAITLLAVYLFRWGVPKLICANLHLLNQAAGIFIAVWYGGGINSPSAIGVLLLPVTALLLAGRKSSLAWLLLSIAGLYFVFWYEATVGSLPVSYNPAQSSSTLFASSLAGIMVMLYISTLVFDVEKNNALDSLIRANNELTETQVKIVGQRDQLTQTLAELKATQAQLIQSEKMASLGGLTAGIAHEIQNPLNFVNNFSEVSIELLEEMKDEMQKGGTTEAFAIATDVKENLQKINHHGKRADSIVKGMLQHSRTDTGQKELTDINALLDEYLRLSYHGLRAKDKSFHATLETDFAPDLKKVKVSPQELGRVLLNLFNNAFYAVQQKQVSNGFKPTVSVSTSKVGETIRIEVRDNGIGIPGSIRNKIMQPFFTTKPTGQGTGLGLSLSYDIITKGHGGELQVESEEGAYTAFYITLPVTTTPKAKVSETAPDIL